MMRILLETSPNIAVWKININCLTFFFAGDFAVLLKAGMSAKQAVFYNLLSSILCLFGMVLGVFLGESETATAWVFAAAAGMFLYIALVDMVSHHKVISMKWIRDCQSLSVCCSYVPVYCISGHGDIHEVNQRLPESQCLLQLCSCILHFWTWWYSWSESETARVSVFAAAMFLYIAFLDKVISMKWTRDCHSLGVCSSCRHIPLYCIYGHGESPQRDNHEVS